MKQVGLNSGLKIGNYKYRELQFNLQLLLDELLMRLWEINLFIVRGARVQFAMGTGNVPNRVFKYTIAHSRIFFITHWTR
jgi:hypothetical protein